MDAARRAQDPPDEGMRGLGCAVALDDRQARIDREHVHRDVNQAAEMRAGADGAPEAG